MTETAKSAIVVRTTRQEDFEQIIELCKLVYPGSTPWTVEQLSSHLRVFPEGQLVAVEEFSGLVLGMAASLIVLWDDYDITDHWHDFTDAGMFTNHDKHRGRTLYGAEIMVHPGHRGSGLGSKLYDARFNLAMGLGLLRIRAGARLRGYHRYADHMTPEEYTLKIISGELRDPTLTFQLHRGFHVLAVVSGYLRKDPESLGNAAVIEWINRKVARPQDFPGKESRFFTSRASGD